MEYQSASLFIIGTELTRGVISDKHGQLMATELSHLGYRVDRIVIVPDDGTIGTVLHQSIEQSDVVLITGGLGPTSDDMTRQMIAQMAGVPLVRDQVAWDELYRRVGERIYGANERQAMIPDGFERIPNPKGTAPGFKGFIPVSDGDGGVRQVACAAMPGPPVEMHEMFFHQVLPWLATLRGHDDAGRDEYSVFMIPESKLEDLFNSAAKPGVMMGDRFQEFRISLYLTGADAEARRITAERLETLFGPGLMVPGDVQAVDILTRYLEDNRLTVSCAESCTSGLAAKLLTDRPGSSSWFWGGAATYANDAKRALLGVKQETLDAYGAVSEQCVREMAEGMLKVSGADLSFSISGIAGPDGGTSDKPVGYIWFGFASKQHETQAVSLKMTSWGRDAVRRRAAVSAILLASLYINGVDLLDTVRQWQYI